ncbi:MAG: YqaE/Pmp3 family membrane protein [Bacteroidia bacterium]
MKKHHYLFFVLSLFVFLPISQLSASSAPTNFALKPSIERPAYDKKEIRKVKRQLRKEARQNRRIDDDQLVQLICAIIIPPLGVYLHEDEVNRKFWICLGLLIGAIVISIGAAILGILVPGLALLTLLSPFLSLASMIYAILVVLDKQ